MKCFMVKRLVVFLTSFVLNLINLKIDKIQIFYLLTSLSQQKVNANCCKSLCPVTEL